MTSHCPFPLIPQNYIIFLKWSTRTQLFHTKGRCEANTYKLGNGLKVCNEAYFFFRGFAQAVGHARGADDNR